MIERTISQSMYDERIQELEDIKRNIYRENLDDLTIRKMRHEMQAKPWTKEDEAAYKAAYQKCSELIAVEEAKPLFNPDEKLNVVTDAEYTKLLEEEEKKRAAEEQKRLEEEQKQLEEQQNEQAAALDVAPVPKAKKSTKKISLANGAPLC